METEVQTAEHGSTTVLKVHGWYNFANKGTGAKIWTRQLLHTCGCGWGGMNVYLHQKKLRQWY